MRAVLLLVFGLIASMPTKFLKLYISFSGVFLLFGGALLMIVMLALAPSYRRPSWVLGAFRSGDAEAAGISNWGCETIPVMPLPFAAYLPHGVDWAFMQV